MMSGDLVIILNAEIAEEFEKCWVLRESTPKSKNPSFCVVIKIKRREKKGVPNPFGIENYGR